MARLVLSQPLGTSLSHRHNTRILARRAPRRCMVWRVDIDSELRADYATVGTEPLDKGSPFFLQLRLLVAARCYIAAGHSRAVALGRNVSTALKVLYASIPRPPTQAPGARIQRVYPPRAMLRFEPSQIRIQDTLSGPAEPAPRAV